jgi:hypothetical protein
MHKIEQAIQAFLEQIETVDADDKFIDSIINEFGENCKKALRDCLFVKPKADEPFKLRMSNIGKPLRQIMLEKQHGRSPMDSQQRLRMTYGYMWESFMLFLLKASGLKLEENKKVELTVAYDEGKTHTVYGSQDLKIDGEIYDIKSASSWSFDNKFVDFKSMQQDDPFGYVGQAMGYSLADKAHFAGWIVVDKSDGRIKVVEVPKEGYRELARKYLDDFKLKIRAVLTNTVPMPPCEGEVEETFRKVPTGNKYLNKSCEFCSCKYICHPELKYAEIAKSEAKTKGWRYYTKLVTGR